jgi:hypothetical protein
MFVARFGGLVYILQTEKKKVLVRKRFSSSMNVGLVEANKAI